MLNDSMAARDKYFDLDAATLVGLIKKEKFFHDMVLPGVRTGSWVYENLPPNYHLWPLLRYLGQLNLHEKHCLDVGTFDGMTAFVMAELGAAKVEATCQYDLDRFRLVRALNRYGSVLYHPKTSLKDIASTFEAAQYDVAVISAMLHHLPSPVEALLQARRLLKRNGMLVLESIFIDRDGPALLLNTELDDPVFGAPTIFVPTLAALRGMLRLSAFEIVSETRLLGGAVAREQNYERVTFLARALRPSQVTGRSAKAAEIHKKAPRFGDVDFERLEVDASPGSDIHYAGAVGPQTLNIWMDTVDAPLQPKSAMHPASIPTIFAPGTESGFRALTARIPGGAIGWDDVYLLGARYPGESMPDGMNWGLKQLGCLHVLNYVQRLGLARVLEAGPGFNLYFVNHLPAWCSYTALDSNGFYDANVIGLANAARARKSASTLDGLLGHTEGLIDDASYDACASVSVLEHVATADIEAVAADMFRVLRPGGWALHSIDFRSTTQKSRGKAWLSAMLNAGFRIDPSGVDGGLGGEAATVPAEHLLSEPLSIRSRFSDGYKASVWGDLDIPAQRISTGTFLVAAQKPREAKRQP
jgi:2-polyprenyl-3-methyl-5-hydroxy-6-metoxy-1,4-benzoquinol methylase